MEDGESPAAAAVRDVKEELGLDVGAGKLMGVDYRPPAPAGEATPCFRVWWRRVDARSDRSHRATGRRDPSVEFVDFDDLDEYVIPVLANRLKHVIDGHIYLEEGRPVISQ